MLKKSSPAGDRRSYYANLALLRFSQLMSAAFWVIFFAVIAFALLCVGFVCWDTAVHPPSQGGTLIAPPSPQPTSRPEQYFYALCFIAILALAALFVALIPGLPATAFCQLSHNCRGRLAHLLLVSSIGRTEGHPSHCECRKCKSARQEAYKKEEYLHDHPY